MESEWYVNLENKPQGTFTSEQIYAFIGESKVKNGAMVWKKGFQSWQPIELHFSMDENIKEHDIVVQHQHSEVQSKGISSSHQGVASSAWLPVVTFFLCIPTVGFFFWILASSETSADTSALTFNWYSALLLSIFTVSACLIFTWRHSNFLWNDKTAPQKGGLLRLFCFFGAISLVVYSAVFGYAGLSLIQISKARSAYNKYTVEVDPASNILSISGLIGPNLSRQVIDKLKVHSDVKAIFIDSSGGLIDEGLSAAKFIESLAGSTVIAHGTCNSSCLLLLMAGKSRIANWNMKLGFHAASAITDLGDDWQSSISDLGEESYAYLQRRGVPLSIIQKAKNKGASKMELVSAIDLYDSGALTGLIDGDELINIDQAKWRFLEDAFKETEYFFLSNVLSSIRESDDATVKKYAAPLYKAVINNTEQAITLMAEMTRSITNRSFKSAEGSALNLYLGIQFLQIRHLLKLEQWKTCVDYSNGDLGADVQAVLSKELIQKEFDALAALIRSASSNKWKAQPIPSWVERTATPIYKDVVARAIELELLDSEGNAKSAKGQCLYLYMLFDKILDLNADTAAPVLRAILTQ